LNKWDTGTILAIWGPICVSWAVVFKGVVLLEMMQLIDKILVIIIE